MSFDMKYDKEGMPIVPKVQPQPKQEPLVEPPLEQVMQAMEPEVAQEPQETLTTTETAEVQTPPANAPVVEKFSDKEANLRNLREQKEQAEREVQRLARERDEYYKRLAEMESRSVKKSESLDEDFEVNPDDLVEGKQLNKVQKELRELKKQLHQYQEYNQQSAAEFKLKTDYPDIYNVVTNDNIALLKVMEPELSSTVANMPDLYTKAVATYKLIKKLNLTGENTTLQERQALVNNSTKPRAAASLSPQQGEGPLSKVNAFSAGLTDELKAQLYKEMVSAKKNY